MDHFFVIHLGEVKFLERGVQQGGCKTAGALQTLMELYSRFSTTRVPQLSWEGDGRFELQAL